LEILDGIFGDSMRRNERGHEIFGFAHDGCVGRTLGRREENTTSPVSCSL
jgi:hypothetical protein